ncbi:FAD:protein FMN transferase [Luteimonas marina]|uniref:FAD:protein FMN transferase n=1 Tax=Luteimonas marina TaxID=488485 RepID=A0A5C5TWR4_9GAMM|nr:FAD:protein FMN transferase [Luteimonas marina]TWT18601.1 FAD:protein FMN transferase [Luteimonas marina]
MPTAHTAPLAVHALYGETMGTRWRVDLCAAHQAPLDALHDAVQSRLDTIVAQMSTYEADSDIGRFNRAPAGSWHVLPDDFFRVMDCALQVADASGGAFDPTIGALVGAWGFGAHARAPQAPAAAVLADARDACGWRTLALHRGKRELRQPGGLSLDLSAIAKGYGVDAVAELLRARGIVAALVDVGGELRGFGRKPDGAPWRVLVETGEDDDEGDPCVLMLDDAAVATSGTRWHRFESDGREIAHTIDPRSGGPVIDAPAAVSVLADDAMHADAWSTALTVMGAEAGFAFAASRGLAARFVPSGADAQPRMTPAFEARLAQ